jgi:hypothetical protein
MNAINSSRAISRVNVRLRASASESELASETMVSNQTLTRIIAREDFRGK